MVRVTLMIQLNILVSPSKRAVLADFGLASAMDSNPTIMTHLSSKKNAGSLRWKAPELFPNMHDPDAADTDRRNTFATDVYAFAFVCYEASHKSFICL